MSNAGTGTFPPFASICVDRRVDIVDPDIAEPDPAWRHARHLVVEPQDAADIVAVAGPIIR